MTYGFCFFGDVYTAKIYKDTYPNGSLCLGIAVYDKYSDTFDPLFDITNMPLTAKENCVYISPKKDEEITGFIHKELLSTKKLKKTGNIQTAPKTLLEYKVSKEFLAECPDIKDL